MLGEQDKPRCHKKGGIAQLGEHLLCKQGVVGSIPSTSTNLHAPKDGPRELDVRYGWLAPILISFSQTSV